MTHDAPDNELLRDKHKTVGNVSVGQKVYFHGDNMECDVFIETHDNSTLINKWEIPLGNKPVSAYLQTLDQYWDVLSHECEEIATQASDYVKARKKDATPDDIQAIQHHAFMELSGNLLSRIGNDQELATGTIHENRLPLTHISERISAIRNAAHSMEIKQDSFEDNIEGVAALSAYAMHLFDQQLDINNPADEITHDSSLDSYVVNDNMTYVDPPRDQQDFGYDEDEPDREAWRESLQEEDDTPSWSADHLDAAQPTWKSPSRLEDEREENGGLTDDEDAIDDALHNFILQTTDFCHIANAIWRDALLDIQADKPVTVDPHQLHGLEATADMVKEAFITLQDTIEQRGMESQMADITDTLQDPQEGTAATMQKIISMASRPELLKSEITQMLDREHKI